MEFSVLYPLKNYPEGNILFGNDTRTVKDWAHFLRRGLFREAHLITSLLVCYGYFFPAAGHLAEAAYDAVAAIHIVVHHYWLSGKETH